MSALNSTDKEALLQGVACGSENPGRGHRRIFHRGDSRKDTGLWNHGTGLTRPPVSDRVCHAVWHGQRTEQGRLKRDRSMAHVPKMRPDEQDRRAKSRGRSALFLCAGSACLSADSEVLGTERQTDRPTTFEELQKKRTRTETTGPMNKENFQSLLTSDTLCDALSAVGSIPRPEHILWTQHPLSLGPGSFHPALLSWPLVPQFLSSIRGSCSLIDSAPATFYGPSLRHGHGCGIMKTQTHPYHSC